MLKIATANSRWSKRWKNIEVTWDELVERLKTPTVTQESLAEYQRMSKKGKAQVKDVGGFVGGWLKEGRRKSGNVETRSVLTLDVDQAKTDLLDTLDLVFVWKGLSYSTHSHAKAKPRYRLVFELSREVDSDEYQAIGRYVAKEIGMSQFDPTSFQPERLMYWPSCSRDAEFSFSQFGSTLIDADEILKTYPNWTDTSYWPLHPLEDTAHQKKADKMEDPISKKGWIGAFCRAHTITDAIHTYLSDIYADGHKEDRFTYLGGSTSEGLVVYDDLFAYSHHGTDPVGGITVNAFDLVRIHLFGDLDLDIEPDTSPSKRPSYKKMIELVKEDGACQEEMAQSLFDDAQEDFADFDAVEEHSTEKEKPKKKEKAQFRFTDTGALKQDPYNLEIILRQSKEFKGKIGFNEFSSRFEKLDYMPWDDKEEDLIPNWNDPDIALLKSYINRKYNLLFGDDRIIDCLTVVGKDRPFHPVIDFINREEWDGEERLSHFFIDYLGAENSSYVKEVTELWFAAAVARICKPGCKFDQVPVLVGAQGIGKSTLIQKIAGKWFCDDLKKLDGNKDDVQKLGQNWIIELGELASMNRTHIDQAKGFISQTEDNYRPPYGRMTIIQRRHVVFIGTTNNEEFLKDATGNRRWYPIVCRKNRQEKSVFDGSIEKNLGQLWAEAYHLYMTKYKNGKNLILSISNERVANAARQAAEAPDVTKDMVLEYIEIPKPLNWLELSMKEKADFMDRYDDDSILDTWEDDELVVPDFVTSREIYDLMVGRFLGKGTRTAQANGEIKKIGMVLGGQELWESGLKKVQGKVLRGFKKAENDENEGQKIIELRG